MNEIKNDLKVNREKKLNKTKTKVTLIKKVIGDQTNKLVDILKKNEMNLTNEFNKILDELDVKFDPHSHEDNILFQVKKEYKDKIEKNELTEDKLRNLNIKISEIKKK